MKVKIDIDCDDKSDLLIILSDVRANVKDAFKKSDSDDDIELSFDSHSCSYNVKINLKK